MPAVGPAPRFDILGNVEEPELELRILGFLGPTARELLLELALVSRRRATPQNRVFFYTARTLNAASS